MEEYINSEDNNFENGIKRYERKCSKCQFKQWTEEPYANIFCFKCKKEVHILWINGYSSGIVEIYHDRKEIIIRVDYESGAFEGGYSAGLHARLNLSQFAEEKSKIPWRSLSYNIRGYNIELNKVFVEDYYDIRCKEWFESLDCKFK
jgi:hypothetical protein